MLKHLPKYSAHAFFSLLYICGQVSAQECESKPGFTVTYSEAWGIDDRNTRYQPLSSLNAQNVTGLKLKWVYGFASKTPRTYPLVTEDTIIIGDSGFGLVALDRSSGCKRWVFEHSGYISSAILSVKIDGQQILLFADRYEGIFAVDGYDGTLIWQTAIDDEPIPTYSGTPLVVGNSVLVPVASKEVYLAMNPFYGCCTTSGGLAAFDIRSGKKRWYLPTINDKAKVTGSHFGFVKKYGPSGAPVWSSPTYALSSGLIYFGTGQNYTHPTTETSDAIFAVRAHSGEIEWITQFTEDDAYTSACNLEVINHPNCAKPTGPDVDFGGPPMLVRMASGRELLIAGQKSADIHAMDPISGDVLWTTKLGRGGIIGGVHWGLAANESLELVFAPISDKKIIGFPSPGEPSPGLYALDMATGEKKWAYVRESRCEDQECVFGLSGAILATNDIVVSGSLDGFLEILGAETGQLLWSYDSWREYDSVNQVSTLGGAFDGHGPMVADDLLMATSGYRYVGGQRGGNAFLVFQLETLGD